MKKTSYKIVFSADALADVKEATKWYNSQQKGLGKRFKEDIKNVIRAIISNPFHASVKYETIRTSTCKTFPYNVHYEVNEAENTVRIISIFHFSRRPLWLTDEG